MIQGTVKGVLFFLDKALGISLMVIAQYKALKFNS